MNVLIFLLFLFPFEVQALDVSAFPDKKTVALNETFVFTIKVSTDSGKLDDINIQGLSDLESFHLNDQWSEQQNSISIVNNSMSRSTSILKKYRFQPKKIGKFEIPALKVRVKGQEFKTRPVSITVTQKNPNINSSPKVVSPFSNPGHFSFPRSVFDALPHSFSRDQTKPRIKLLLDLDKKSIYKTERVRADWMIFESSSRPASYDVHKIPVLKGFWKEDIHPDQKRKALSGTQVINGILYRRTDVDSLWIFPLQTGKLKVDSYSIRLHHFFSFPGQEDIRTFPSQTIQVKALPTQDLDDSFTGAVGSFNMTASLDKTSAITHQPLSYKIIFEGSGHPRFINLPPLKFPSSLITYSPVEKDYFSDSGQGKKEFEILIIPKQEGIINIPSFTLSTFDPIKERYIFHQTPSFSISVARGQNDNEEGENFLESEKEKEEQKKEFQPLTKTYWPQFMSHRNLKTFWFILLSCCMVVLMFLYAKNLFFKKEISLKKKLKQRFKAIQNLLNKKDWQNACAQMIRVNYEVLYSASVESAPSDWKQALASLPPILNKKYASQFEKLFRKLEDLSFSEKSHFQASNLNQANVLFTHTKTLLYSFLSDL